MVAYERKAKMKKQYKKDSWYGRIFLYVHEYFPDTNTCEVRSTILLQYPWTLFKNFMKYPFFGKLPTWALVTALCQVWLWMLFFQYGGFAGDPDAVEYSVATGGCGILLAVLFIVNLILSCLEVAVILFVFYLLATEFLKNTYLPRFHLPKPDLTPIKDAWDDFYRKICKPVTWE
jgi:hypothetical protein